MEGRREQGKGIVHFYKQRELIMLSIMTDGLRSKSKSFSMRVKSTLLSRVASAPLHSPAGAMGQCHHGWHGHSAGDSRSCWGWCRIPLLSAPGVPGSAPSGKPQQNKGCSFLVFPTPGCSRKRDPAEL